MGKVRFDGRVAVVTGAGNGLGRSYALALAARGAKVVVNDLGGSAFGEGAGTKAADAVVTEITSAGGIAAANYDSVTDGGKIIQNAMDHFGRIDIVINNAGILRDKSFHKMEDDDWDLVYDVHVKGAYKVTHAAWNYMRDQEYGRLVFTASSAGIYGNFGQANYSMAKLGLHGLSQTLAIEGVKKNILSNTIAPIAGSRLTETVMSKEWVDALKPDYVTPLVLKLCDENSDVTGALFEAGAGWIGRLRWERTKGKRFDAGAGFAPEDVLDSWEQINDYRDAEHPATIRDSNRPILGRLKHVVDTSATR